jgi:hypothetical protein
VYVLSLLKKIATIATLNIILVLFFILASYSIANDFNSNPNDLLYVHWNFFGCSSINHAGTLINGNYVPTGATSLYIDFPFWLFFVSTAINMAYIVKLLKDQENQHKIKN